MKKPTYTLNFGQIALADVPVVSGKNASLSQPFNAPRFLGGKVVDGFAVTADAHHSLLMHGYLEYKIRSSLSILNIKNVDPFSTLAHTVRAAILETAIPEDAQSLPLTKVVRAFR